jgi:hypothetical protein
LLLLRNPATRRVRKEKWVCDSSQEAVILDSIPASTLARSPEEVTLECIPVFTLAGSPEHTLESTHGNWVRVTLWEDIQDLSHTTAIKTATIPQEVILLPKENCDENVSTSDSLPMKLTL